MSPPDPRTTTHGRSGTALAPPHSTWDGRCWTKASAGLEARWYLEDVEVTPSGDVWAVGRAYPGDGGATSLVVRWDGAAWIRVESEDPEDDSQLYAISATADDDLWAVGTSAGLSHRLIEHWDGHGWSAMPSASPGSENTLLEDVAATGPSDAWAVGGRSQDPFWWYTGAQLLLHWDGSRWTSVRKDN